MTKKNLRGREFLVFPHCTLHCVPWTFTIFWRKKIMKLTAEITEESISQNIFHYILHCSNQILKGLSDDDKNSCFTTYIALRISYFIYFFFTNCWFFKSENTQIYLKIKDISYLIPQGLILQFILRNVGPQNCRRHSEVSFLHL